MPDHIYIRDSNIIRRLLLDDILFAEAKGDYIWLHTTQKLYAVVGTMSKAENRLPPEKFIRVHRSYIVAVDKIDTVQDGGIVIDGRFLPVADSYRRKLNQHINLF